MRCFMLFFFRFDHGKENIYKLGIKQLPRFFLEVFNYFMARQALAIRPVG